MRASRASRRGWRACALAAVACVGTTGCFEIEDDGLRWYRGRADALALGTVHRASALVGTASRGVPSRCRNALPSGPRTVTTQIHAVLKVGGWERSRQIETQVWRRDEDGNVEVERSLTLPLPDGRTTERSRTTRVVGAHAWRAIDGRFASVDAIAGVSDEAEAAWSEPVDALLALVAVERGALVAASPTRPALCPGSATARMPDPAAGRVERSVDERSGWLRWHAWGGPALLVHWSERVTSGAEPVAAPDEVWPVHADRSWSEVTAFVEALTRDGWIEVAVGAEATPDPDAAPDPAD